jgi:hypothetical protein
LAPASRYSETNRHNTREGVTTTRSIVCSVDCDYGGNRLQKRSVSSHPNQPRAPPESWRIPRSQTYPGPSPHHPPSTSGVGSDGVWWVGDRNVVVAPPPPVGKDTGTGGHRGDEGTNSTAYLSAVACVCGTMGGRQRLVRGGSSGGGSEDGSGVPVGVRVGADRGDGVPTHRIYGAPSRWCDPTPFV